MRHRKARSLAWPPVLVVGLTAVGWFDAGVRPGRAVAQEAARPVSEDEAAIRKIDEAFVREYNRGESKALAARFTEDAEVIEANGDRYQGRELIERSFAATFAAAKGSKIAFEIDSIRFLNPDAAKEEGRSVVSPTQGAPIVRRYTVLYAKRAGHWLIASVREEPESFVPPRERLQDLAWMIGDWVDEGPDSVVQLHCDWSADRNFLIRSFTVQRQGKPVLRVTQRIGWDPVARHIRSWEFDSEGGFGGGTWSRDGDRWVVKHSGVRPEGTTASATNTMIRERSDLVRWVSTDRVRGDESLPDEQMYVLVRVAPLPARPKTDRGPDSAPAPSPSNTRSPR